MPDSSSLKLPGPIAIVSPLPPVGHQRRSGDRRLCALRGFASDRRGYNLHCQLCRRRPASIAAWIGTRIRGHQRSAALRPFLPARSQRHVAPAQGDSAAAGCKAGQFPPFPGAGREHPAGANRRDRHPFRRHPARVPRRVRASRPDGYPARAAAMPCRLPRRLRDLFPRAQPPAIRRPQAASPRGPAPGRRFHLAQPFPGRSDDCLGLAAGKIRGDRKRPARSGRPRPS